MNGITDLEGTVRFLGELDEDLVHLCAARLCLIVLVEEVLQFRSFVSYSLLLQLRYVVSSFHTLSCSIKSVKNEETCCSYPSGIPTNLDIVISFLVAEELSIETSNDDLARLEEPFVPVPHCCRHGTPVAAEIIVGDLGRYLRYGRLEGEGIR